MGSNVVWVWEYVLGIRSLGAWYSVVVLYHCDGYCDVAGWIGGGGRLLCWKTAYEYVVCMNMCLGRLHYVCPVLKGNRLPW